MYSLPKKDRAPLPLLCAIAEELAAFDGGPAHGYLDAAKRLLRDAYRAPRPPAGARLAVRSVT